MGRIDLTKTIGELNLMRKVLFVPPSMMASGLMARMQATHIQMALVIDEYGGTDGLVSLEDIVEMVVGDIEDEHDDEEIMIAEEADGVFVVDARADLEELAAKSARLSKWENMARMSTRSAVSSSLFSGAFQFAAKSCRQFRATSSMYWKSIRVG